MAVMFERFGPAASAVIEAAFDEARALRHPKLEPEHYLLALLRVCPSAPAVEVLMAAGIDHAVVWHRVRADVGRGPEPMDSHMPFSSAAKTVLTLAAQEAGRGQVDPEHLLAGLVRRADGMARQLLDEHGITLAAVRATFPGAPDVLAE